MRLKQLVSTTAALLVLLQSASEAVSRETGLQSTTSDDNLLAESRNLVGRFAATLQSALQDAMGTGGPVAAIEVCKDVAPRIAADMSAETGAVVGRTSLKPRNPDNAPQAWQRDVLESFDEGSQAEFFERTGNNGARYLQAIKTGAICLNCHGTVLAPPVRAKLDAAYPDDRARGYYLDDVRGAFSIVWPGRAP